MRAKCEAIFKPPQFGHQAEAVTQRGNPRESGVRAARRNYLYLPGKGAGIEAVPACCAGN